MRRCVRSRNLRNVEAMVLVGPQPHRVREESSEEVVMVLLRRIRRFGEANKRRLCSYFDKKCRSGDGTTKTYVTSPVFFTFSADFQAVLQYLTCKRVKFTTNKQFYIIKLQRMGRNVRKRGSLDVSEDDFSEE